MVASLNGTTTHGGGTVPRRRDVSAVQITAAGYVPTAFYATLLGVGAKRFSGLRKGGAKNDDTIGGQPVGKRHRRQEQQGSERELRAHTKAPATGGKTSFFARGAGRRIINLIHRQCHRAPPPTPASNTNDSMRHSNPVETRRAYLFFGSTVAGINGDASAWPIISSSSMSVPGSGRKKLRITPTR